MANPPKAPTLRFVPHRVPPDAHYLAGSLPLAEPKTPSQTVASSSAPTDASEGGAERHVGDFIDTVRTGNLDHDAVEDKSQDQRQRPGTKSSDYEVGYGKPPKEHQFPKGRSPNAKGRPKGSLSLKTELKTIVGQLVAVTENGKRSKRSTLAVLLMKLRADALAGKPKAIDQLLRLILTQLPDDIPGDHRLIAVEDAALLAKFKGREV